MSKDERHSAKGWGRKLAIDPDEPMTREDAALLMQMTIADRLLELLTVMQTVGDRLHRLEAYVEEHVPGYTETSAYRPASNGSAQEFRRIAVQGPFNG